MSASGEITRLRYLAAMAVPVYVTRRALPGAAVTAKFALRATVPGVAVASEPETLATGSAAHESPAPRGNAASPAAQALRESLRKDTGKQAVARDLPDASPLPASKTANHSAIATRFRLAAVICAGRLWLEALGDEALAREQVLLIEAMGRALSHPGGDDQAPVVTEFRWPLHDNAQLGLGAEEAAATLQGFLFRQLEENACVELICLGDSSKALLAKLSVPCARRFTPSTRDVLENPLLKRDIWTALRV